MKVSSLLIYMLFPILIQAQETNLDSLENLLPEREGEEKVNLLNELCWQYGAIDIKKSEEFGRQALSFAYQFGDSLLIAQVYNDLGTVFFRKSEYDSAIMLYKHSLRIRQREGKDNLVAASNSKIGTAYQELGKFDLAIKYQLEAIRYYEEAQDSIRMSQGYTNLARVFYDNHEYEKSIRYNEQALDIFTRYNYTYGMATTLGSQALNYQKKGNARTAITLLENALELFRSIRDNYNIATVLLDLGQLYREQGDIQKGISYYQEAIALAKETNDLHTFAMTSANLANIFVETGEFDKAEKLYLEALDIAIQNQLMIVEHQCYRGLSELYKKTGRYKDALDFKSKQYSVRDSIYNIEKYEQLSDLETKYETEKKEQEIELLTAKNEINQLLIRRQQAYILAAIVGIGLLFIISLLWYNRKRLQQKALLEAEKNKFRKKLLHASVEAEEKERKRIARELHDGVAQQLSGLKMAWQVISKELKGESEIKLKEITKTLDDAADEVRNISHQMMPKVLSTNGLVLAIEDMLAKSLKYSPINFKFEHFAVDGRFDEKIELSLYRVCQELVNNVIKHSGANFVSVQLFKSNNNLILMLEDNGKGISPENKKDGIGLLNIASRIDTVDGEINYEPSPASGTVATVRIPLVERKGE
ncbi:MAG: sensor histidine kinase [Bacteroidales bacterium]